VLPPLIVDLGARELLRGRAQVAGERGRIERIACESDDGRAGRQETLPLQRVERGDELPVREVARRPEDHDRARGRRDLARQALAEWRERGRAHEAAWWLARAACTSSSRRSSARVRSPSRWTRRARRPCAVSDSKSPAAWASISTPNEYAA